VARVIAVDAGTTGVRALVVDEAGAVTDVSYRELTQYFPRPGWVEHDASEIWDAVVATLAEVAGPLAEAGIAVDAIGITNQRETVVAWDRADGRPRHRAVVWQDRRTAERCDALRAAGHLTLVRERTGLVLDPYFSATKMAWLLEEGGVETGPDLVLATVDTWVAWNLTGATAGGVLATDISNASRTLLCDIGTRTWSSELAELFGVPLGALPEIRPSCGRRGTVAGALAEHVPSLAGVPVSGVAGDQQAALFGQVCTRPGMAKVTYGTGSFVLLNVGATCPPPSEGLLATVAWDLGDHGGGAPVAYALEGAVFVTGAAIQWLRDGLGLIDTAADVGPLASSIDDCEGVYVVPAFTGLGSPWWDPYARGTITGLTRGTGAAHIARAVVEATAFQVRDVVDAMVGAGCALEELRVDGGASVMDLLLQLQADQLRTRVARPVTAEITALGAATLAGLAEGVWSSLDELEEIWTLDAAFSPVATEIAANRAHQGWTRAVARARGWALPHPREPSPA
jgi:glycerol kinase